MQTTTYLTINTHLQSLGFCTQYALGPAISLIQLWRKYNRHLHTSLEPVQCIIFTFNMSKPL